MSGSSQKSGGYTIVELSIIISVTAVLALAFGDIAANYLALITRNNAAIDMTASAQSVLRGTVEALRTGDGVRQTNSITDPNAPPGGWNTSNANFVIVIATPAEDSQRNYIIDSATGSPYMNELVYYKDNNSLKRRALANPNAVGNRLITSCPANLASPSCPADAHLADYTNTMSFTLYDQDNNLTTDPLLARSIKIDLSMSRTVFGSPIAISDSIRVTLRNRF